MNNQYTYFESPGHGWVEVPYSELQELGINEKITRYSYWKPDTQMAYLEEDCDMTTWFNAFKLKYGVEPTLVSKYIKHDLNFDSALSGYMSYHMGYRLP